METALIVSLSNQMVLRRKMDIIANNLANMSTTAFKRESALFEEFDSPVEVRDPDGGVRTTYIKFVRDYGVARDLSEGQFDTTTSPLDIAIKGDGYFIVSTPDGERYTRNGHFSLDDRGRIVTNEGYALLDEGGGELVVQPGDEPLKVAGDGTLSTRAGVLGRIGVVDFEDVTALRKMGNNLYQSDKTPIPSGNARLVQGMLERSNVEPVIEMTQMIEVMRAYQQSSEIIQTGEDMVRRAVQKLGEVKV